MGDDFSGVDRYDFEAGNWPLKVQIALGYASLADQIENDFLDGTDPTEQEYLRRAFNAAFRQAGADRYRYFNYQTNDGKDFWAEGPYYFHYAPSSRPPSLPTATGSFPRTASPACAIASASTPPAWRA